MFSFDGSANAHGKSTENDDVVVVGWEEVFLAFIILEHATQTAVVECNSCCDESCAI